jgi:DNA mismatch endonuclease (patch repair protein)
MARVRGKDTKPELLIRRALHARGLRFRLHRRDLPGRPDLTFPSRRAVVQISGCFWHGHGCHLFKWPGGNEAFWREKIGRNRERDARTLAALNAAGWRVMTVWECAMRGRGRLDLIRLADRVESWVRAGAGNAEVAGGNGEVE